MLAVPLLSLAHILEAKRGSGDWAGASLRLFKNDFTPGPASVVADFIEADYTGYAAKTVDTVSSPYLDASGNAVQVWGSSVFRPTGTTVGNVIYGWFLVGVAAGDDMGKVICAARLSSPKSMGDPMDAIVTQAYIGINQPQQI